MIEPFNLKQVRKVELHGNQNGTKVGNFIAKQGDAPIFSNPCVPQLA